MHVYTYTNVRICIYICFCIWTYVQLIEVASLYRCTSLPGLELVVAGLGGWALDRRQGGWTDRESIWKVSEAVVKTDIVLYIYIYLYIYISLYIYRYLYIYIYISCIYIYILYHISSGNRFPNHPLIDGKVKDCKSILMGYQHVTMSRNPI